MAQDRFFAYVDQALVDSMVLAAKMGAFAEENNPATFHPGATLSFKQTQFDVTNVQLTFHQGNQRTVETSGGPVDCVVVEPDVDFYKDLLAHFFAEVLPNELTRGKTDPRAVYVRRWTTSRQSGFPSIPYIRLRNDTFAALNEPALSPETEVQIAYVFVDRVSLAHQNFNCDCIF